MRVDSLSSTAFGEELLYSSTWLPIACGLFAHHGAFKHGEWHLRAPDILLGHIGLAVILALMRNKLGDADGDSGWRAAAKVFTLYCSTLFSSIVIYRVFFHRLSKFPGPSMARATKLWHFWKSRTLQNYLVLDGLHKQYGDFVRTGPCELTVFHPDVHSVIDGSSSACQKSDWKSHDARRRIWDRAFGKKAFEQHETSIQKCVAQLETCVASLARERKPIDVSTLFRWFSWDVMGEVMFTKSFNMLKSGGSHATTIRVRRAMDFLGRITPAPWVARVGFRLLPFLRVVEDWLSMIAFCHQSIEERTSSNVEVMDISSILIADAEGNGFTDTDWRWLHGDSVLGIIAGSDTVVAALSFLFYRLAEDPVRAETLYKEVVQVDTHAPKALQSLPYLNALINETLRLHPPVPTGGARQTPPEGIRIGGIFIPGNTTVIAPRFTTARLRDCFRQAEDFEPERWFSRPEMIKSMSTFVPFGTGRFSCVGKVLGLTELRTVTASLVKQYKIHYADSEDGSQIETQMTDTFTATPGRLMLQFSARTQCSKLSNVSKTESSDCS